MNKYLLTLLLLLVPSWGWAGNPCDTGKVIAWSGGLAGIGLLGTSYYQSARRTEMMIATPGTQEFTDAKKQHRFGSTLNTGFGLYGATALLVGPNMCMFSDDTLPTGAKIGVNMVVSGAIVGMLGAYQIDPLYEVADALERPQTHWSSRTGFEDTLDRYGARRTRSIALLSTGAGLFVIGQAVIVGSVLRRTSASDSSQGAKTTFRPQLQLAGGRTTLGVEGSF